MLSAFYPPSLAWENRKRGSVDLHVVSVRLPGPVWTDETTGETGRPGPVISNQTRRATFSNGRSRMVYGLAPLFGI